MSKIFSSFGSAYRWVLQPLLVVGILALGFLGAMGLSSSREAPQRQAKVSYAPLVRIESVHSGSLDVTVQGNGSLRARTRIELIPQVGGKLIELHPALRAGGHFAAGEVLARIEAIDYELALARAQADVSSAATALEVLRAEAEAAGEEWGRLNPDEPVPTLVGREPQVREAEAGLAAAEAQLAGAQLDLQRTALSLPFDGRVVDVSIDVGQVLAPNQSIGAVYGTDVFEVPVPLELDELAWVRLPGDTPGAGGSPARVTLQLGSRELVLEGRAARLESQLDGTSRLSRLIVEVSTEGLSPADANRVLPGLFVDVQLEGGQLEDVVALPREALRDDGVVWTVVGDRLEYARPKIERATDTALFVSGLETGTRIVVSNLEVVIDGMQVRVLEGQVE